MEEQKPFKILSIDGGDTWCIPAMFLANLEKQLERKEGKEV